MKSLNPISCFWQSNNDEKIRRKIKGKKGVSNSAFEIKDKVSKYGKEKDEEEETLRSLSVKEQERRLKEAKKEEGRISREAEKVVKWVKQESARIDIDAIKNILIEEDDKPRSMFEEQAGDIAPELISIRTDNEFPSWFNNYILNNLGDAKAARLQALAHGPSLRVNVYKGYFVNGYVFHTEEYGQTKSTWNSGVNLKGNLDYYGVLKEVIELEYLLGNSVVLFNCEWRDAEQGITKHGTFDLVDLKHSSRHNGDDVFILASQAQQVYMTPYPRRRRESSGWWAVWKTKARSTFDIPLRAKTSTSNIDSSLNDCYQEEEMPIPPIIDLNDNVEEDEALMAENTRPLGEEVTFNEIDDDNVESEEGEGYISGSDDEDEEEDDDEETSEEEIEFCSDSDQDCSE